MAAMLDSEHKRRKLPDRELEIVGRLKEAREFLRFTQKEFAEQIGITRQRLASYEEGRARLRWEIALRACRQFFISEFWLATGILNPTGAERHGGIRDDGDTRMSMSLFTRPLVQRLRPGMLFSECFDKYLRTEYVELWNDSVLYPRVAFFAGDDVRILKNALTFYIDHLANALPPEYLEVFFMSLIKAAIVLRSEFLLHDTDPEKIEYDDDIYRVIARKIDQLIDRKDQPARVHFALNEKKELTDAYVARKSYGMKSPLDVLVARIAKATRPHGKKAALAQFLKIPQSRVSEWLHGKGQPGGEVTLRLLEWVEAEEAQQKTPGGAETAAKGKTRSIHSKDETKKSGPIKS